jgi:Flp pilus assembly protein TadD
MTEQELKKAREYFQQAASLNPNYAPAYAGLADYYTVTTEAQPNVASERAKTYARQALLLDEALAEAHLSLAKAQYNEWDWGGAEREVQRAIELNSSYSEAHRFYAIFLSALGREQKARTEIRDAQQLDPVSVFITTSAGWVEYFARNYDGAIRECKKALELDPINVNAHDCLGSAYLGKGMNQDAISECRTATTLSKGDSDRALCLGLAYAAAGQTAKARRVLQRLYRASRTKYVPPSFFALLHAAVGEKKQAFGWLDKSYDVRDPHLVWINVSPAADPLRASPQWQDFVRRIGMPS